MSQHDRGAVGGDLDNVVGSVRVRLLKISDDYFVDAGGICANLKVRRALLARDGQPIGSNESGAGVDQLSKYCTSPFEVALQVKHGSGNRTSFRPSETNHADATTPRGRGDRYDCVVEVHGKILASRDEWQQEEFAYGMVRRPPDRPTGLESFE